MVPSWLVEPKLTSLLAGTGVSYWGFIELETKAGTWIRPTTLPGTFRKTGRKVLLRGSTRNWIRELNKGSCRRGDGL